MLKKLLITIFFLIYFSPCLSMEAREIWVHNGTNYAIALLHDSAIEQKLHSVTIKPTDNNELISVILKKHDNREITADASIPKHDNEPLQFYVDDVKMTLTKRNLLFILDIESTK